MVDKTKKKQKEVKQPKKEVKQTKKNVKQLKKEEYIYNPDTKRNVKKNGDVGKKVLEKYGGGTVALTRLRCCGVKTGTPTGTTQSNNKAKSPAAAAQVANLLEVNPRNIRQPLKCCREKINTSLQNQGPPNVSKCFNNTNIPNASNSGLCFQIDEKEINEIFQLTNTLNEWNQSNSLILPKNNRTNANAKTAKTNANTRTFEITITPPPPTPPNSPTNSPSGDCDLNIDYDNNSKTVTITGITTDKCGLNTGKLEAFKKLIKQILEEILNEFVNIFEKMINVDVKGLVKGIIIAIIVDTIFEDLCKDGSKKQKICNYPEIKILMNVTMNNFTASPIQIVAKTTIGIVKSKSELSTLQDMIRKFYVAKHYEQLEFLKR